VLEVAVAKRLGEFELALELEVPERSMLVVVGESGSGKSTLLRLLAGLTRPDRGHIRLDGESWFDGASSHHVPAPDRSVGFVAQDYALFPHLTVAGNVAFGLHAQGTERSEVRERVRRSLDRLGIAELEQRRSHELSGGQKQRVALARALVLEPRLLLLDEPLSALDVRTRRTVRGELRRLLEELPCVTLFVTHSPSEALALGGRIAVLEGGHILEEGSPEELLQHPHSEYVAEFLGGMR
jgi:molybdate transport system ATP-binding protein